MPIHPAQDRRTSDHPRFSSRHFLPYAVCHLCYDRITPEHGDQAFGKEDTGWTLSRFWIR
jgi:hypothetical protein